MFMWFVIIGLTLAVFCCGLLYISFRAAHFAAVQRIAHGKRWLARLLCFLFFAALTAVLWIVWNMMNAIVCMIHLVLFWLLCDLAALVAAKIRKKPRKRYWAGAAAIVLCTLWLAVGWIAAHHVWTTRYTLESKKLDRDIRIVQVSDSHVGATFDAVGFLRHIGKINDMEPDVVVITGDFVDDDTSREDMLAACYALGKLTAPNGVFFVYGNHDKGYYSEAVRGWTNAELRSRLVQNGVIVLEDASVPIDDGLYIVGRKDRSEEQRNGGRMSAEELLSMVDSKQYIVVLDHQQYDFDGEAAAGADLVLCGHTHGGQFIPIRYIGEWIGENALRYGHEKRQNTDFIVSSGISNWTFRFKTGCHSEIVVIELKAKQAKE
jgi:predicted MPP superfamily phosphohydrolase